MKYLALFRGEWIKTIAEFKRYLFNTIAGVVLFYFFFLALFFGLTTFGGPGIDQSSLDAVTVGYIMFMVAMGSFGSMSNMLMEETQRGTLEQLYLGTMGVEWTLIFRMLLESLFNIVMGFFMLFLAMLTTGSWLPVNFPAFLGTMLLSLPSLWGVGLIAAALTLVHKKVQVVMSVLSFGIVAVVAVSAYPIGPATFLPFAAGATTINASLTQSINFSADWYLLMAGISAVYLALGMLVFDRIGKYARRRNLLGQY